MWSSSPGDGCPVGQMQIRPWLLRLDHAGKPFSNIPMKCKGGLEAAIRAMGPGEGA